MENMEKPGLKWLKRECSARVILSLAVNIIKGIFKGSACHYKRIKSPLDSNMHSTLILFDSCDNETRYHLKSDTLW